MLVRSIPAVLLLASCRSPALPPHAATAESSPPAGLWWSDGYGVLLDLRGTPLKAYEVTDTTCLPIDVGDAPFSAFYDAFSVQPGGETFQAWDDGDPHRVQYRRGPALPAACSVPAEQTPASVFAHFSAYLDAHYAFFDLYGIDWSQRAEEVHAQLRPDMPDAALFALLAGALDGIDDTHVELWGEVDGEPRSFDADAGDAPVYIERHGRARSVPPGQRRDAFFDGYIEENVSTQILGGAGEASDSGYIRFGMADTGVGYLAIMHVGPHATGEDQRPPAQRAAVAHAIRRALALFRANDAHTVLIDLSINFGGFDFVSREIARHFAAAPTAAYQKQAADTDHRIPPTVYTLAPAPDAFTGEVVLLTSDLTVSGGEVLTMSLRALPNVTHAGEPTRGALSDKLEKPLPNGWMLSLSNEAYRDHRGVFWEGRGIEPDAPCAVLDTDDPLASHLAAVRSLVARASTPP